MNTTSIARPKKVSYEFNGFMKYKYLSLTLDYTSVELNNLG